MVFGADLAQVLLEHAVTPGDLADLPVRVRVQTDGSLFDALRAATLTMDPNDLWASPGLGGVVDERWRATLDVVSPPELREHLGAYFLEIDSSRNCGGRYCGATWPHDSEEVSFLAAEVIAGWEFGEGHAMSVVIRLADEWL